MLHLIDYLIAGITAIAILVVNVAASYGVVAIYAHLINPGREAEYYKNSAQQIAPWSSVVVGMLLFFGAAYILGVTAQDRNAFAMAIVIFAAYAVLDLAIMLASGQLRAMAAIVALSLVTKLVSALIGAQFASGH